MQLARETYVILTVMSTRCLQQQLCATRRRKRRLFAKLRATTLVLLLLLMFAYYCAVDSFARGGFAHYVFVMADRHQQRWYDEAHVYHNICFIPASTSSWSSSSSSAAAAAAAAAGRVKNSKQILYNDVDGHNKMGTFTFTVFSQRSNVDDGNAVTRVSQESSTTNRNMQPKCYDDGYGWRYCAKQRQSLTSSNTDRLLRFSDQLAIIPLTSPYHGFFKFMYNYVLALFGLVKWIEQNSVASRDEINKALLLYPRKCSFIQSPAMLALFETVGPHQFQALSTTTQMMCFKKAVFGRQQSFTSLAELDTHLSAAAWAVTSSAAKACQHVGSIVFIQRETNFRRIFNLDEVVAYFRRRGHTDTRVVVLERLSFAEQMRVIKCARVLVAVQGAGLTWFLFLPRGAVMVEITWHNWSSRFAARAHYERPDLRTHLLRCRYSVSVQAYRHVASKLLGDDADVRNSRGSTSVNQAVKDKVFRESERQYTAGFYVFGVPHVSIWKSSDCVCDVTLFDPVLEDL